MPPQPPEIVSAQGHGTRHPKGPITWDPLKTWIWGALCTRRPTKTCIYQISNNGQLPVLTSILVRIQLERGAQSYHSVVNCVLRSLGIYRMSIVADVRDQWMKQSFLGILCTYGDNRHLTNLVLCEGYRVKFMHYAIHYTDIPIRFITLVIQQTQWSKSFFREIPIQLGCMRLHSLWMTYALFYQLSYPMTIIYNLVDCVYFDTGSQISWWLVSTAFVGILRTCNGLKVTGDKKFFFTTVYGFLYMLGYVPAKIFTALAFYNNSWGTRQVFVLFIS